jgi:hypothetical protein
MAVPPAKKVVSGIGMDGAIPRMGLNIPVPPGTKPPPAPSNQQSIGSKPPPAPVSTKPAAGTKPTK